MSVYTRERERLTYFLFAQHDYEHVNVKTYSYAPVMSHTNNLAIREFDKSCSAATIYKFSYRLSLKKKLRLSYNHDKYTKYQRTKFKDFQTKKLAHQHVLS